MGGEGEKGEKKGRLNAIITFHFKSHIKITLTNTVHMYVHTHTYIPTRVCTYSTCLAIADNTAASEAPLGPCMYVCT